MTTPDWSPQRRREVRRVMLSSYLGTTIEFYDFLLYGTAAAVVFNQLFFTDLDPLAGTLASFGTLAVGYVARPLGGVVFGHFGDRVGRKSMLVTTMTIMVWPAPDRRVGRRPVMIGGALLLAALAWPVTALVAIGSVWSLLLAFLLGNTLSQAAMYGPMAAFISEMFGTSARYTGASLGYQLATMIGGGFGPVIASVLLAAGGGQDLTPIAVLLIVAALLSAAAIALTRETCGADLSDGDLAATPETRPAMT